MHVNAVYSNVTVVTYDYYSYPFCEHEGKARVDESLGEWFLGGRIRGAPFSFTFLKREEYTQLCSREIGKKGEPRSLPCLPACPPNPSVVRWPAMVTDFLLSLSLSPQATRGSRTAWTSSTGCVSFWTTCR